MTPRLPTPGSDDGAWGNILNDFLTVSHGDDGKLAADSVGSIQVQTGSLPAAKLDAPTQAKLTKATTSVQTVNTKTPDANGGGTVATANDLNADGTVHLKAAGYNIWGRATASLAMS